MSQYTFCPRGKQEGILVTSKELEEFALKNKREYIDSVIPLPEINSLPCLNINRCSRKAIYWENIDSGAHGWCCSECGRVIQWG